MAEAWPRLPRRGPFPEGCADDGADVEKPAGHPAAAGGGTEGKTTHGNIKKQGF